MNFFLHKLLFNSVALNWSPCKKITKLGVHDGILALNKNFLI